MYNSPLPNPGSTQAGAGYCTPTSPATGAAHKRRRADGEVKIGERTMKYAIVESGGKQFKAVEGETILVDRLPGDPDLQVDLDKVLLLVDGENIMVGSPTVKGAKVNVTIAAHPKGPKITIFKYAPKKRRRVKTGHRQEFTELKVNTIEME
jgi:large subunit ribosomal protein L21